LKSGSPAINFGTVLGSPYNIDFDGKTRVGNYDAGAYEFAGTTPTPLIGDINGDRIVNSLDYSLLKLRWLTSDQSADLNDDGIVNSIDYSLLKQNWLKTN
jgi:hypothetical protein